MPDARLQTVDLPPFRQRLPWLGPDLQTMRGVMVKCNAPLELYRHERLFIPLNDGSGDTLSAMLGRIRACRLREPLVVLIHGLTGLEDSFYMRESAAHFLSQGYPVLRLNLRGAGRSRPLCAAQYNAGSSDDLDRVFAALAGRASPRADWRRWAIRSAAICCSNIWANAAATPGSKPPPWCRRRSTLPARRGA